MKQSEVVRREPNLKRYTEAEIDEMLDRFAEFLVSGKKEEADKVMHMIPLAPKDAKVLKELIGVDKMIAQGINLSEAVEAYGHEWLER